jgi:hypothetical protein
VIFIILESLMSKNILSILCAVPLFTLGIQSVLAESVAIKSDSVFIVDNSVDGSQIIVKNLADGSQNTCLADAGLNLLNLVAPLKATDIVINKEDDAVITTYNSDYDETDIIITDVSSCLTNQTMLDDQCITTVDNGMLIIPCVQYNDQIFSVVLEQRGASMNWELKSSPILNDTFIGHKTEASRSFKNR